MTISTRNPHKYIKLGKLVEQIQGDNGRICLQIFEDHKQKFIQAPGSHHNHQAWPGGYYDHVTESMNLGCLLYDSLSSTGRQLPFCKSDVLLITFLHDIEKPFRYWFNAEGEIEVSPDLPDKPIGEVFKINLIQEYGIQLNEMQANALEFVEGIRDHKYRPDSRVMGELATVCHLADLASARLFYNYPLAESDPWTGASRVNPAADDVTLETEFK